MRTRNRERKREEKEKERGLESREVLSISDIKDSIQNLSSISTHSTWAPLLFTSWRIPQSRTPGCSRHSKLSNSSRCVNKTCLSNYDSFLYYS